MKIFASALIAVCLVTLVSGSYDTSDQLTADRDRAAEQELKALEVKLNKLSLSGNPSAITDIIDTDFLGMDGGVWDGKFQWVPQDRQAFTHDVVATSSRVAEVTVDELEARVHGQIGIVRGRAVFNMKDGKMFDTHFLDTWERRNGRWIQVAAATSSHQTH